MKKILLSTVFALACLQNVQADPFEIDLENLGTLKTMVIQFKETNPNNPVFCALDEIIQGTEKKQDLSQNRMKNIAINQALLRTRKTGTYPPILKEILPAEENLKLVQGFHENPKWAYTEEEKAAFYNTFKELEQTMLDGFKDPQTQSIVLAAQKSGLRQFTGKVLGMTNEWTNYEVSDFSTKDKEVAFQLLKESGALKTKIEKVEGFVYNPAEEITDFLINHPETDTIVLGCGHFIPKDYSSTLCAETPIHLLANFEGGGCHMCPHPTHHKGELTLDLETAQNPDIVADATDLKIWNAIPQGRLARIVDDSIEDILSKNEALMDLLKRTLKPGGEIIVMKPGKEFTEEVLFKKPL